MTTITDITTEWSSAVKLPRDEIWQARDGVVCLTTTTKPGAKDGLMLKNGDGIRLSTGLVVRFRKESGASPYIVREGV
jgi:hypothetical protein